VPGRAALCWGDPPANMRGMGLLVPDWDMIFLKDAAAVAKFCAVGLKAELLHEAMNPAWHVRNFTSVGDEIVVAGNYYGYRQYLVSRLLDAGVPVALYGPAPPRWAMGAIQRAHRGRYVVRHEKSRIFGTGLACLNSTSLSEGNSLNCRAFEIAGACGLQLIEDKSAVATCFEPGREALVYRSVDEICEYVVRARRDPAWAMGVREAGYARAVAHHTYALRLGHMLSRLGYASDAVR
jgi:spore maturation protein CgeB